MDNPKKTKAKVQKEVLTPEIEEVKNYSLSTEEIIQNEIRKYSVADAVIAEHKEKFKNLKIKGINDKEGYKLVKEAQLTMRDFRTAVENKRKDLKADSIKIGKGIDDEAKRLTALIVEVEEPLKKKREAIDELKRAEEERIAKEAEEKLNARVKELEEVGLKFDAGFYSIGENISVDVLTIQNFSEETFAEFKKRVSEENDRLKEAERIRVLHNERMDSLREVWAYLTEEQKSKKFGNLSQEKFDEIMTSANKGKADFEEQQRRQAEEAEKQINERKALNYEKRSFQLEKEGFQVDENGDVSFIVEAGAVRFSKSQLETLTADEFKTEFDKKIEAKNELDKKAKSMAESRKNEAERRAKEESDARIRQAEEDKFNGRLDALLNLGLKFDGDKTYIFHDINFDIFVDVKFKSDDEWNKALIQATKRKAELDKEIEEQEKAESLAKLPEIEKVSNYIDEVLKVQIPKVTGSEIGEILSEFKNKIKLASDEAKSNLKNLS